jgi:hypothetical protein
MIPHTQAPTLYWLRELLKTYCAGSVRVSGARFTPGKGPRLNTNATRSRRFLLIRQLNIVNFFRVVPAQAGTQWRSLINDKRH